MDPNPFLYLQIAESIRRQIVSGELRPGDRLPSVRTLSEDWNCTPGTVSHAYQLLTLEGLVVGHRGRGTVVASGLAGSQDSVLGWANLVNRAEHFLLEAIGAGHTPVEAETALSVAVLRWQELQSGHELQAGPPARSIEAPLRFVGSNDLIVDLIPHLLSEQDPAALLSIQYSGSLGGLIALSRSDADLAGSHLWDETTNSYNLPFIQRILPGKQVVLLTLAHRQVGLILPPGNPQQVHGLEDLPRPGVRFVNRQPGSGSRVWLDAQLKRHGFRSESISGYEREETTHLGVAKAVAQGEATVGLGIFAAASSFDLEFVPLTKERYDLVFPEPVWNLPQAQEVVEVVRSQRLKEAVSILGGYDTAETGREIWVR